MLYKIKNGLVDIDSHQYIQANDSRTRGKDRLYQDRFTKDFFSKIEELRNYVKKKNGHRNNDMNS
jgi:hypothetical protein